MNYFIFFSKVAYKSDSSDAIAVETANSAFLFVTNATAIAAVVISRWDYISRLASVVENLIST